MRLYSFRSISWFALPVRKRKYSLPYGGEIIHEARDFCRTGSLAACRRTDTGRQARAGPAGGPPRAMEKDRARAFLCCEKPLRQAFRAARKLRASQSPDPGAALREMEAKGILAVPQTW